MSHFPTVRHRWPTLYRVALCGTGLSHPVIIPRFVNRDGQDKDGVEWLMLFGFVCAGVAAYLEQRNLLVSRFPLTPNYEDEIDVAADALLEAGAPHRKALGARELATAACAKYRIARAQGWRR